MNCPCCHEAMQTPINDAPFCFTCGLYAGDDPADCDDPDHQRQR